MAQNAGATNLELAGAAGLTARRWLAPVKRLEKAGCMPGCGGQIQMQRLRNTQIPFTEVMLSDHRSSDFTQFAAAVHARDVINECRLTGGGYDYLLKLLTRKV